MVVANSTPLIYLAALSDFHLLRDLYGTVIIPQAVFDEVVPQAIGFPVKAAVESALQSWLSMGTVRDHHRVSEIARTAFLDPAKPRLLCWPKRPMCRAYSSTTRLRSPAPGN